MATITFTKSETKDNQYNFTYEFTYEDTVNCDLIECSGAMEPQYTGLSIEHFIVINFNSTSSDSLSEILEKEEGIQYGKTTFCRIEKEVYEAFYNQVKF